MDFIGVFLVACALAIDCFAVSVSVGLCRRETSQADILRMGIFFGVFQTGMTLAGFFCGAFLASYIGAVDHWIAFALLGLVGVRMIREAARGEESRTFAKRLEIKTLAALAVATSLDALAIGLSFGLVGHEIVWSSLLIGAVALFATELGTNLGKSVGKQISSKWAEILGGIVLIAIGLKILAEHLS